MCIPCPVLPVLWCFPTVGFWRTGTVRPLCAILACHFCRHMVAVHAYTSISRHNGQNAPRSDMDRVHALYSPDLLQLGIGCRLGCWHPRGILACFCIPPCSSCLLFQIPTLLFTLKKEDNWRSQVSRTLLRQALLLMTSSSIFSCTSLAYM
jgi:hypothetical protein